MARRSFIDRVRDLFRPRTPQVAQPPQAPPPPSPPLPTRPSRNQPPSPPRQAPKPVPSRPSRTFAARTLSNYNGWRQVRIMSNTQGDMVNFIKSLPAGYLVIGVAYGETLAGDTYSSGELGWITVQSKMYAGEVDTRGRVAFRRAGFGKFADIETLIVRYGAVRTLGDQAR